MKRFQTLAEGLTISDQLLPSDVAALAAHGVKTILCNRPDHEEPGQPTSATIAQAAQAHGIAFIAQPVSFSALQPIDGVQFAQHLASAAGPVHAYCRSGRRCVALWALANVGTLGTHGVLAHAQNLGEDLRGLAPLLAEIEAQSARPNER